MGEVIGTEYAFIYILTKYLKKQILYIHFLTSIHFTKK